MLLKQIWDVDDIALVIFNTYNDYITLGLTELTSDESYIAAQILTRKIHTYLNAELNIPSNLAGEEINSIVAHHTIELVTNLRNINLLNNLEQTGALRTQFGVHPVDPSNFVIKEETRTFVEANAYVTGIELIDKLNSGMNKILREIRGIVITILA